MPWGVRKVFVRVRDACDWRIRELLGDALIDRTIVRIAQRWRPFLKKPVFIGITGSAGKTTTKELLVAILSSNGKGSGNPASLNVLPEVAKTILRVLPSHDFCVAELSEDQPDAMRAQLALLQPSIGIVTVVGYDHLSKYESRDAIATEMAKLIASLPAKGTAVLNADDELVVSMAADCVAKVITYGVTASADLRAEDVSAVWPDRLKMNLVHGGECAPARTQLCGTHWISSVLGAVGGGLAAGLSLKDCANAIASVAPFDGRMQPITTHDGVTFIRDDFKAPLWAIDTCLEFMKAARARRKIVVIGELSDMGSQSKGVQYARVAILAQQLADVTVFVGPSASSVLKAKRPDINNALRVFGNVRDAAEYVNSMTREGDLVLLKGTNKQDHLLRILLARKNDVACWRNDCKRDTFCNQCPDRTKPSGAPSLFQLHTNGMAAPQVQPTVQWALDSNEQVVVGLGNAEARYIGTPHNIGHELVEQLAASLGLNWVATPEAWIARGSSKGQQVCLIKVRTAINLTGSGLKFLSESMAFSHAQCILVYDDLDTPIGTVRTRLNGSAGGHRGVASILEAFQTDAFRRVKVGVGSEVARSNPVEYVLTAFDAENRTATDLALVAAQVHVLKLVDNRAKAR